MTYALLEYIFACVMPWVVHPGHSYRPLHWGFSLLLFVFYPLAGLVVTTLIALGVRLASTRLRLFALAKAEDLCRAAATLTLVAAFAGLLVANLSLGRSVWVLLCISMLLACGLAVSGFSTPWAERLRFCTNPFTTSLLLLGPAYLSWELLKLRSLTIRAVSVLAYLVTVLLISFLFQRRSRAGRLGRFVSPALRTPATRLVSLAAGSAVVLLTLPFLKQQPLREPETFSGASVGADRPNVILVALDTVRADHLSLYGYERNTSSFLKKFAEEAVMFTNAVAPGDMTLSTHGSMFTGLYPVRHQAHYSPDYPNGRPLSDAHHTLAEMLSEQGYLTMAVVANLGFLGPSFAMDQGFQYYDVRFPVPFLGWVNNYYLRAGIRKVITHFTSPTHFEIICRRAEEINKEAIGLLDNAKQNGRKFFLFLNYMDAHWPYIPPPPFDRIYPGKDETFTLSRYFDLRAKVLKEEATVSGSERRHILSQYDGAIAYMDRELSRLLTRLKEIGLYENSLIIITSDHGEMFGERGLIEHGVAVYQDTVRVPLIVKYPNSSLKSIVSNPVSLVDLLPTVLETLRYQVPQDIDGKSLVEKDSGRPTSIFSETYPSGQVLGYHHKFDRVERAIFHGPFKFISSTRGKRELYNLSNDPHETVNLYQAADPVSSELQDRLAQRFPKTPERRKPTVPLDPVVIDRLKSLGYVQ